MLNKNGYLQILQCCDSFLTFWFPHASTKRIGHSSTPPPTVTAKDCLSHIQKGIHLPSLLSVSGRVTVSILALSRSIQRDEMSSDVAPDCTVPMGIENPNLNIGEVE